MEEDFAKNILVGNGKWLLCIIKVFLSQTIDTEKEGSPWSIKKEKIISSRKMKTVENIETEGRANLRTIIPKAEIRRTSTSVNGISKKTAVQIT